MNSLSIRLKRLTLILGLLVAANAASFLVDGLSRGGSGERRALLGANADAVARLEFLEGDARLVLVRSGSIWFVEDGERRLEARAERVRSLLDTLRLERSLRRVARSVEARERLGLGSGAMVLRALDAEGRTLVDLRAGANDAAGRSVFVAFADEAESWSTDPAFVSYLGASRKAWLDLRLGGPVVDASEVVGFSARGALTLDPATGERYEANLSLERDDSGAWRLAGSPDAALDAAAVDRAVRMLLGFEADDIAAEVVAERVALAAGLTLGLKLADGSERTWTFAEAGEGSFEGVSSESPFPFEASAYRLRSALPRLEDMRSKP